MVIIKLGCWSMGPGRGRRHPGAMRPNKAFGGLARSAPATASAPYPANCVAVPATMYQVTSIPLISAPGR